MKNYTTYDILNMQKVLKERAEHIHKIISSVFDDCESLDESQYNDVRFFTGLPELILDEHSHVLNVKYEDSWDDCFDDEWAIDLPAELVDGYTDEQIKIWFVNYANKEIEKNEIQRLTDVANSVRWNQEFVKLLISWIDKELIAKGKDENLAVDWYPVVNKVIEEFMNKNKEQQVDNPEDLV